MDERSQLIPASPVMGFGATAQGEMRSVTSGLFATSPEPHRENIYAHCLDKPFVATPAQCEMGHSLVARSITRKRRCRSCTGMCYGTFRNRMHRSLSVRALFVSAIGGAALLAGAAVVAMSKLTNGLAAQTMLPNIMAGAASSQAGLAVGGGVGLAVLSVVGCVWWCGASCRLLSQSNDERFLHGYKKAFQTYEALMTHENLWGPLPPGKALYKTYLADDYMKPRTAECKNILLARNASEQEMAKFGFVVEEA